jgi:hypothetical protein
MIGTITFPKAVKKSRNLPDANVRPTAVSDVNIRRVEELILGKRQIAVRHIASNGGTNVGSVVTITYEQMLTFDRRALHVAVFTQNLHRFELEKSIFHRATRSG